ncbi:T9SS-dependent choice-of-anchor J family protein [Bergeyella zoohelcum]|uniref:Por secretion system C-terminal sorting domain n=1 Tax=Bergeyella zoohelcum TaxID=1015 RepID=A0A7Z8YPC7_9FLAO|nr:choice-of-anchor J domain-containing protein [Bergeyella zoohelcum]VDH05196.1 Por secretion system C-terminal sorting domain [Bergeyella zoohelcum]
MKKILLSAVLLQAVNFANAQVTLLNDSFETYTDFAITGIGNWQTLDLDGGVTYTIQGVSWANANVPQAYIVFNPSATTPVSISSLNAPKTGDKYMACFSSKLASAPNGNEDWLVTPVLNLGASGNSLSFWVKSHTSDYGLEKYRVGVYTGTGTPTSSSDFTIISGPNVLQAPADSWTQVNYDLDAYANQSVRIGILCESQDAFFFMVDDVVVTTAQLSTNELTKNDGVSVENPTTGIVKIITEKKIQYAKVFDATGKLVSDKVVDNTVDISAVPSGVYYLNVLTTDNKVTTKKVIKK